MSGFIAQLKSKAASAGLKVTEVNPYKLKLSQYVSVYGHVSKERSQ